MIEQIYESSRDYFTGAVVMMWDGERPTDEQFRFYAEQMYGVTGELEIHVPSEHKGLRNPGTAVVTPNAELTGRGPTE